MIRFNVPFYPNPDETHCLQSSLRSVLKYFVPEREYSWRELEEFTAKKKDMWTWPIQSMIKLKKMGFEVVDMEDFDYESFSKEGKNYLISKFGKKVGEIQAENSDLKQEMRFAMEFIKLFGNKFELPETDDIKEFIRKGYLVLCNVNSNIIFREEGYSGHFIVVTGYDDKGFFVNDSGYIKGKNKKVSYKLFRKAWAYPDIKAQNLIAVKR